MWGGVPGSRCLCRSSGCLVLRVVLLVLVGFWLLVLFLLRLVWRGRLLILIYGLSGRVLRGASSALRAGGVVLVGSGGACGYGGGGGALYLLGWGSVGKAYGWIIGVGHAPLGAGGRLPSVGGGGGGLWSWYTACQ